MIFRHILYPHRGLLLKPINLVQIQVSVLMQRLLLTVFLLSISFGIRAQQLDYFNSEAFWTNLLLIDKIQAGKIDTAIIVVSTRARTKDKVRFMGESRSKDSLNYFFVYAYLGKWHLLPVRNLSQALQYIPNKNKDWVIYAEGMGKIFTSDVDRGMRLSQQYDVNVILLDYPSITTTKKDLGNYRFAIHNARNAHRDFVPVLDTVKRLHSNNKMGSGDINLFFHSMGNNIVKKIVKKKKLDKINDTKWVNNIILNAPCVYQSGHKNWLGKINFANAIYIHYNPEDKTLSGAHLISFHKQLGEKVRKPVCKKACYINFNTLVGPEHSYFLNLDGRTEIKKAAFKHYYTLFHGDTASVHNPTLYRPTAYRNIGWDILP